MWAPARRPVGIVADMSPGPWQTRYGGPPRLLLVVAPGFLLMRMREAVRSIPGVELAGGFGNAEDALGWAVWNRHAWHVAYVDMTLPGHAGERLAARLSASPRAGVVVGLTAHLWEEERARLRPFGVSEILEKGDHAAFRDHVESALR